MRDLGELLRMWSASGGDRRPWFALTCVPDLELEPDEVVVPRALAALAFEDALWIAPIEAPFFGARVRAAGFGGGVLRLSPRTALGPDVFAERVFVRVMHADFHPAAPRVVPEAPRVSLSIADLHLAIDKPAARAEHDRDLRAIQAFYDDGLITDGERYNKAIDLASATAEHVNFAAGRALSPALAAMREAGVAGERELSVLAGVPGLVAKRSGELREHPVWASAAEGWTPHEHAMLAANDRAVRLKDTHQRGEALALWVQLSRVLAGIEVTTEDCGARGVWREIEDEPRLIGRTLDAGTIATSEVRVAALHAGLHHLRARTLLRCAAGACAACAGVDPATGERARVGARIGAAAARAIAERAVKLVERWFSICGGTYTSQGNVRAREAGVVRYEEADIGAFELDGREAHLVVGRGGILVLESRGERVESNLPQGAEVYFADGEEVPAGALLAQWNPWSLPRVAELPPEVEAEVHVHDPGGVIAEVLDEITGLTRRSVTGEIDPEHPPAIVLTWQDDRGEQRCTVPLYRSSTVLVADGDRVRAGQALARSSLETRRSESYGGGLQRLLSLLAAEPVHEQERAVIARAAGRVVLVTRRRVVIETASGRVEHALRRSGHTTVRTGDRVRAGDRIQDGVRDHHELLAALGSEWLAEHLEEELRGVFQPGTMPAIYTELIARAMTADGRLLPLSSRASRAPRR